MAPPRDAPAVDDWDVHWTAYGDSAEDNPAQQYRRRLLFDALGHLGPEARLADIGSGQGDLLVEAHKRFPAIELLGVEQSVEGIRQGTSKVPTARFVRRDLSAASASPEGLAAWATHATCSEVIEHVDDPVALLTNAAVFLAPTCQLVITVPGGPRSAYDRHIGHRRHYSRDSLRTVIEQAGFEVVSIDRAGFPIFNLYKLLVVLRGRRLIEDVRVGNASATSKLASGTMTMLRRLFRFARRDSRWGWQLVATATPSRT